eukprot:c29222_g2_i2 orf=140-2212(+)
MEESDELPMLPTPTRLDFFTRDNVSLSNVELSTFSLPLSGPSRRDRDGESRCFSGPLAREVTGRRQTLDDGFAGRHGHLLKSGRLGKCDDSFCTTCPVYQYEYGQLASTLQSNDKVHTVFLGGAKNLFMKTIIWMKACIPGVMNPHAKIVQRWNKFFVITCLVAIFVDPLFFFLLSVNKEYFCIVINSTFAVVITVLRSLTDAAYFVHILLQFRLAYIGLASRRMGAGELVDDPKEIVCHYLTGWFGLDLFVLFPLPQVMIWIIIPKSVGKTDAASYAKNLLRVTVLLQYIPRMIRFVPLLAGNSPTGFIFETAWANFFINISLFILVAHVVGSCWYLFGLQRVNQCLHDACFNATSSGCDYNFIDCGEGKNIPALMEEFGASKWKVWITNANASDCLMGPSSSTFTYGIYSSAVSLISESSIASKYFYSLFWGFQQISTLAGNQVPSLFVWEVLFTIGVEALGLLLLVLLIGNMQNFLQSLSRRRLEMQLRRHDVELWMGCRHLPLSLRRRVREAERFKWAANRGVNEEELLKTLPEDLQKEIRRFLCLGLVKRVRLFMAMEDLVLDAICERLHARLYIEGSEILRMNHPIEQMHFIIRGNLQSIGEDKNIVPLQGGDFCGDELLTWCLEHGSAQPGGKRGRMGQHAVSSRTVRCLGSVEAFSLDAADLEEVTMLFSRSLRNAKVQGAI